MILLRLSAPAIAAQDGPARPDEPDRRIAGNYTFFFENDIVISSDDNYTAGVGLNWVSDDVALYDTKHFARRFSNAFAFLPLIRGERYRRFVALTLGFEMYTPTDLEAPVPPPDQQPYAGVIVVDGAVYGHGPRSLHGFIGRIGCVGPCSGAAEIQTWLHERNGSPVPQGWDYQLRNELLLNLSYQYHRRVVRFVPERRAQADVVTTAGGGFGNYYIGANVGLVGRFGWRLPDNYVAGSLRSGGATTWVGTTAPGRGWQAYLFAGIQVYGVARFLPTDGNTFRDSPSVERDNFIGNLATGVLVGKGRFALSWALNSVAGFNEFHASSAQDFGTITLTWYLGSANRSAR